MKKKSKLKSQDIKSLADDWGIDYQTFTIKMELVDTIKQHCEKCNISQRKLASMVEGLTQDRISKIFSGQVGHMTIDKLVQILSALDYQIKIKAKAA